MADDWQEAAFSNRHTHNRVGKRGGGNFNVQKTFGSYEIKSSKFSKSTVPAKSDENITTARLEIYTLNEEGNALLGEIFVPGCLRGSVVMAGSRRVMKKVIRGFEEEEGGDDEKLENEEEQGDEEEEEEEEEQKERTRFKEFEKNSFRSPKFWLKWQGQVEGEGEEVVTDDGYIVFSGSGNGCEKFEGTISCEGLGWKNVKISGWKVKGMGARDFEMQWVGSASASGREAGRENEA